MSKSAATLRPVKGNESLNIYDTSLKFRKQPKVVVKQNKKLTAIKPAGQPMTLQPFPMLHPETGKPTTPDALFTLPSGKTITAAEYYKKINGIEEQLVKSGRSLRQLKSVSPTELRTVLPHRRARESMTAFAEPALTEALRVKQAGAVKAMHRPRAAGRSLTPLDAALAEQRSLSSEAPGQRALSAASEAELRSVVVQSAQARRARVEKLFTKVADAARAKYGAGKNGSTTLKIPPHKVLIFTSTTGGGAATSRTTTSGEFASELRPDATAGSSEFALRVQYNAPVAKPVSGTLKIVDAKTGVAVDSALPISIGANESGQNFVFKFPATATSGVYRAVAEIDNLRSKATITYTAGPPPDVKVENPYARYQQLGFPPQAPSQKNSSPPMGDPSFFSAFFETSSDLSQNTGGYRATATLGAYVLGEKAEAAKGKIFVGVTTGGLEATAEVLLFGQEILTYGHKPGGKALDEIDEAHEQQLVPITFEQSYEYTFVVGFIPITVECTLAGQVSGGVVARLKPADNLVYTNLITSADMWVDAKTFVDAEVAGAGFYGHLHVLSDTVTFQLDTVEKVTSCYNDLYALEGEFGLYAFAYLPAFSIPPWKLHQWNWPWAKWDSPIQASEFVFDEKW